VAADGVDPVALSEALASAEARIEATAARVVRSRAGRLLEVEALEADGALWSEFAGLSSWLARALSPMDAREARPGRRRWSQRAPVAGRLFGGVDATGLRLRLSRDGDGLVGQAAGRWDGDPPLRVELVSEHLRAPDGLLARGRVDVRARARRDGPVVYVASAEVRALGAAGVRALGSEVVGEIEVGRR
jgi:hypothetical protein